MALHKLHNLHLGPIIRHSTKNSLKLWGQGNNDFKYLVARIHGTNYCSSTTVNSDTNYIGVINLQNLDSYSVGSIRQYQMAMTDRIYDSSQFTELDWDESQIPVYKFKLESPQELSINDNLSFIFGSCRFLWPIFGCVFFGDRGDKVFRAINKQSETRPVDFVAMLGDQIYADTSVNIVDKLFRAKSFEDFNHLYYKSFSYPHIKRLLANNTVYMIGDDHEYRDNYNLDIASRDLVVYSNAITTFNLYQYVNSPEPPFNGRYWFTTIRNNVPFFWIDARNERTSEQIMSVNQLETIKSWLLEYKDQVKCLVSSVPMFLYKDDGDNWLGYKHQLKELLDTITKNSIQGLVILTGDSHMGVSAQYSIVGTNIVITELMSSGFYAIFHADKIAPKHSLEPYMVEAVKTSPVVTKDLFSRVDISVMKRMVNFSVYDNKGSVVTDTCYNV